MCVLFSSEECVYVYLRVNVLIHSHYVHLQEQVCMCLIVYIHDLISVAPAADVNCRSRPLKEI